MAKISAIKITKKELYNNVIKVEGAPFRFIDVNLDDASKGFYNTIHDNDITSFGNSNSSFKDLRGFDFKNNICHNSGIRVQGVREANILDNTFNNGTIRVSGNYCSDINFINNVITGNQCFNDDNDLDYNYQFHFRRYKGFDVYFL